MAEYFYGNIKIDLHSEDKRTELFFFTDPSHGWLKVSLDVIKQLAVRVSKYSYKRGNFAYLEEDLDAQKFLDKARNAGMEFKITHISLAGSFVELMKKGLI